MTTISTVMIMDTHSEPEILLFSTEELSISYVRELARTYHDMGDEVELEEIVDFGWWADLGETRVYIRNRVIDDKKEALEEALKNKRTD